MKLESIHAHGSKNQKNSSKNTQTKQIKSSNSSLQNSFNNKLKKGKKSAKYSLENLDKALLDHFVFDLDRMDVEKDVFMMDDEEVGSVSNFVADQRNTSHQYPQLSMETVDASIPMMELTSLTTVFVVDTNFIISHLPLLEGLRQLANKLHHQIVIPGTVIQELDGLKKANDKQTCWTQSDGKQYVHTVGTLARWANDWIYKNLANKGSGVMGQKLKQKLDVNCIKDDSILDCCLYFKEKLHCFALLLSNDKNLCLKALTEDVLTVSYRKDMTATLIATKAYEENIFRFGRNVHGVQNSMTFDENNSEEVHIQNEKAFVNEKLNFNETSAFLFEQTKILLINLMSQVLEREYGEDLEFIGFDKNNLNTLNDCANCIYKLWLSVFSEYLRKSNADKDKWKSLPEVLTQLPTTSSDLTIFFQFWKDTITSLCKKHDSMTKGKLRSTLLDWEALIKRAK